VLILRTAEARDAAEIVLVAVGFKRGAWHDVGWSQPIGTPDAAPGERVPFPRLGGGI
jgi:hypothetical protein